MNKQELLGALETDFPEITLNLRARKGLEV